MTIIGFNFSKLHAEQLKPHKKGIKISTNIKIDNLSKTKLSFDKTKGAVKASFSYEVQYGDVGTILLAGDVLEMQEIKVIDSILEEWKEKKTIPKALSTALMTQIMNKSAVQAIILAKDIGLPSPIPMPKFKSKAAAQTKKAKS